MSIFEIANPYYSIDGDGDDDEEILMLTIEVKPCD